MSATTIATTLADRPITHITSKTAKTGALRSLGWIADTIRGNEFRPRIEAIRAAATEEQAEALKAKLPAVMFAGHFPSRKKLVEPSGLVSLDFDDLGAAGARDMKARLAKDPHTALAFISPRGEGVKLVVPFTGGANYGEAFDAAAAYYKAKFSIEADKSCRDVGRLCFVGHDPACCYRPEAEAHVFGPSLTEISTTTYNPTPYTLQDSKEDEHLHPTALKATGASKADFVCLAVTEWIARHP